MRCSACVLRFVLGASTAAALAVGCRGTAPSGEVAEPAVRVVRPLVREVTEYCYFTGRTDAVQSVNLQSRVTGYLESIDFVPGEPVKAGRQLFKIDPRPYQAKLDIADAQVSLSKARLKLAEADLARATDLLRTPGVISQADVDKYVAAQTEATASVAASEANAREAQLNLDYTSILAPIDGVVGRNYPSVGDLISRDNTLLTTVVSQDPIYAYFEVDEQIMLRVGRLIHEGKIKSRENGADIPVEMALADEGEKYPHHGMMDFINNRISPTTGTLEIRAKFDNPMLGDGKTRMFKPGMFVRVRVPVGQPADAILVPQSAIGADQGRRYVLVVNAEDRVEQRLVTVGPEQPGGLQVVVPARTTPPEGGEGQAEGTLGPDDRVIIGGLQLVRPGVKVRIRELDPTTDGNE